MSLRILLIFAIVHMKSYVVQSATCAPEAYLTPIYQIGLYNRNITWETCYDAASKRKYKYAVLVTPMICVGLNADPPSTTAVCNGKCSGNPAQQCGSNNGLGGRTYISAKDVSTESKFRGCYYLGNTAKGITNEVGGKSADECLEYTKASGWDMANYAMLKNTNGKYVCSILYDINTVTKLRNIDCDRKCPNSNEMCGSTTNDAYASVYQAKNPLFISPSGLFAWKVDK